MPASRITPNLPLAYEESRLYRNLEAIEAVNPGLGARLREPVAGRHVRFSESGELLYVHGNRDLPLDESVGLPTDGDVGQSVLILGIGTGRLVLDALASGAECEVWDRDPWLLRLFLMAHDVEAAVRTGRLRLFLGVDLLRLTLAGKRAIEHPLLGFVYSREIRALTHGLRGLRVLVCAGRLLVDDVARELERKGYALWTLDVENVSLEELSLTVRSIRPSLVVSINYVEGLVEFCARHAIRLVVWEIDPSTTEPRSLAVDPSHAHVFTYRAANVEAWRRAGYRHVEHLPLAADLESRRPVDLDEAERERYGSRICFVGSSMVENAVACRERFLDLWVRWCGAERRLEGERFLRAVLDAQRETPFEFRLPALFDERAPGLRADFRTGRLGPEDPLRLVGEMAASEKRLGLLTALAPLGVTVWGDTGWSVLAARGVRFRGAAGHGKELNRVFAGAAIVLDVGRIFQNEIVTLRVFEGLACGRFVLTEASPDLFRCFRVGEELESYANLDELRDKASHYLAHPEQARAIAERGREAVRGRHSLALRLSHMLKRSN